MRALVIDDSRGMRRIVSSLLEQEGFTTAHVGDGRAALDVLERDGAYDLACIKPFTPDGLKAKLDLLGLSDPCGRTSAMRWGRWSTSSAVTSRG